MTAAAINDLLAWCLLALVVAVAQFDAHQSRWTAAHTAVLAAGYVAFMLLVIRPFLVRLQRVYERQGRLSQNLMAVVFLLVLCSAYATQRIGIHVLVGAFLMGCVMPKGSSFVRELSEKMEDFTVVFLLPLFFAYAGLRTDVTRIFSSHQWGYAAIVIAGAWIGKIGGAAVAARLCKQPWRESAAIGVLMNTRGLMELIILSIGLSLGVINQNVYAILVVMTLTTTAMTAPLLALVYPERLQRAKLAIPPAGRKRFTVLIPISDPRSGIPLLHMAAAVAGPEDGRKILALHLRRPAERDAYRAGLDEPQTVDPILEPLLSEAKAQKFDVEPIVFVSRDVPGDIAGMARSRQADLVLMGFHRPVFGRTILGGTVRRVLSEVPADIGIYVNRAKNPESAIGTPGATAPSSKNPQRVLVPYLGSLHDRLAMELAQRLAKSSEAAITVLHVVLPHRGEAQTALGAKAEVDRVFTEPEKNSSVQFRVVEDVSPVDVVLREAENADLVLIGMAEEWGLESNLFGFRPAAHRRRMH